MARVPAQRSDDLEQLWVDGRKHDERRGAVIVYELQRAFEVGVRARVKAVVRVCVEVVIALYRGQKVLLEHRRSVASGIVRAVGPKPLAIGAIGPRGLC